MHYIIRDIELNKVSGEELLPESVKVIDYFDDLMDSLDVNGGDWNNSDGKCILTLESDNTMYITSDILKSIRLINPPIDVKEEMSLIKYMLESRIDGKIDKIDFFIEFQKEIWLGQGSGSPEIEGIN